MQLGKPGPVILPSLLLCDFGRLADEIALLEEAGVEALHLDVMDGHFVPNLTYGMPIVEAVRRHSSLPLDVHLMIAEPQRYVEDFCRAGADGVTVHVEACDRPGDVLKQIRSQGAAAGIALNPATPLEALDGCLDLCDLVLVMSVDAGFGGQAFNPVALEKLARLRRQAPDGPLWEVDGGVNESTIGPCAAAGARLLVVGSAIFRHDAYGPALSELRQRAAMG